MKESFSLPRHVMAAAKAAAECSDAASFSEWIEAAVRRKLDDEHPTLIRTTKEAITLAAAQGIEDATVEETHMDPVTTRALVIAFQTSPTTSSPPIKPSREKLTAIKHALARKQSLPVHPKP